MGDQLDFISRFHNLEGDLKGERTANFFKLLRTPGLFSNEQELESALKNLNPKTYQESLFYIDTLLYFKRTSEILEILKEGNEEFISKILKQTWFFKSAFQEIDTSKFVNDFLPCVSFSVRKRLITKVLNIWNERKIDSFFDALDKKYGLTMAVPVLHKCTESKIMSIIQENEIILLPNQVLHLYKRNIKLFTSYVDHYNTLKGKFEESKVLNYVAKENPKLLVELEKNCKIRLFGIGKRTTKTVLKEIKDEILLDSDRYFKILKNPVVIRALGKDFAPVYKQFFPKKFSYLNVHACSRLLKYYPKHRRWNLFLQTCNELFADKTLDDILLKLSSIKELNPPKEVILKWAELNYKQQEHNYKRFLGYYEPSKAIPMIKEIINVTSDIFERRELISLMITSCKENNDLVALEEVLKYICFRHRNEDVNFRNRILDVIKMQIKLEDLNENHWKYIDEQLKILRIQNEINLHAHGEFFDKHLEYLIKNGQNYKATLTEYINDMIDKKINRDVGASLKDVSVKRRLYIDTCKIFSEEIDKTIKEYRAKFAGLVKMTIDFSVAHTDHCIRIADIPGVVSFIQQSFDKTDTFDQHDKLIISHVIYYNFLFPECSVPLDRNIFEVMRDIIVQDKNMRCFQFVINQLMSKKILNDTIHRIIFYYIDNWYSKFPVRSIVSWFLKNDPKALTPYISKIVRNGADACEKDDCKLIKQYSHLNFDTEMCRLYIDKLGDDKITNKAELMNVLRILLSTDEFLKLVNERYLPVKYKLDLQDKEMRDVFHLQCEVAKGLGKVIEPHKMLPTIMKFCKGDYLQSGLQSLYKAFYRSPEKMLYSYVEALSKQAVSARKHAIFLSCEVLDKEHTLHMLKNTAEENVSSRKYQFSATLKYFLKHPSQDLLDKLVDSMSCIDINDTEVLDSLKDVVVPTRYRPQYLEKCWKFFEGLTSKGVKIEGYLDALIINMKDDILRSLSETFVTDIIKRYFPVGKNRLSRINSFVLKVLTTRVSEANKHLQIIFEMLVDFPDTDRTQFFQAFISETRHTSVDQSLVYAFNEKWIKHFSMIDSFDERICLKLFVIELENPSLEQYASNCVLYLNELVAEFGSFAYEHFRRQLKDALEDLDIVKQYTFCSGVLKYKIDASTCTLVMQLIDRIDDDSDNKLLKPIYENIDDILKSVDIPIVRVNYKAW